VDQVFEEDGGFMATRTFIDVIRPKLNGIRGMLRARQRVLPVDRAELMEITEDWARAAFQIEEKDLLYMERLVMLQNRHTNKMQSVA
jgi:DSF synthase